MAKKKEVSIEERTFPRSIVYKGPDNEVSITMQPYITGMYVAITDSRVPELIQLSLTHKEVPKWTKRIITAMEKEGMEGSSTEKLYRDYLSIEEMEKYNIFQ